MSMFISSSLVKNKYTIRMEGNTKYKVMKMIWTTLKWMCLKILNVTSNWKGNTDLFTKIPTSTALYIGRTH